MNSSDRILLENLLHRLESLRLRQDTIQSELDAVESQIKRILSASETTSENSIVKDVPPIIESIKEERKDVTPTPIVNQRPSDPETNFSSAHLKTKPKENNLEKFIGENLISKIGIAITIIGVAFGAKYAIDHGILSPMVRILLGYLLGGSLLFLSFRLKEKYLAYSAVLNGGAFAVFYLVTFFAFNEYGFIPRGLAFILMVLITAGTVYSAIRYDSKVLAQIGMVGAYSVPFLLSDNSGRVAVLFTYIAVINIGILIVAFQKSWKFLFISSFGVTWLIFGSWAAFLRYDHQDGIAIVFLIVFTLIFWATLLSGIWLRNERAGALTIIFICIQMLLFLFIGSSIYDGTPNGMKVFLPLNVLLPAITYVAFRKLKSDEGNWLLTFFVAATFFIYLTCNEWFDAQWVTISLSLLALGYMIAGRNFNKKYFEEYSYYLFIIALLHLGMDWVESNTYLSQDHQYRSGFAFQNLTTLASGVMILSLFIALRFIQLSAEHIYAAKGAFFDSAKKYWPVLLVAVIYMSVRIEISAIWVERYHAVENIYRPFAPDMNPGLTIFRKFESLSLICYTAVFLLCLSFLNQKKFHSASFGLITMIGTVITMLSFLTSGLYALRFLRKDYLNNPWVNELPDVDVLRYGMIALLAALVVVGWFQAKRGTFKPIVFVAYDCISHAGVIWILTSELIRFLELNNATQVYKYGLTVLWGSYALFLIVLGIWLKRKHIRIMGMIIFGVTLVKLLVYDLDHLSTIAKAGLFLLIGAFMLLVSYLYLKFRKKIFGEED